MGVGNQVRLCHEGGIHFPMSSRTASNLAFCRFISSRATSTLCFWRLYCSLENMQHTTRYSSCADNGVFGHKECISLLRMTRALFHFIERGSLLVQTPKPIVRSPSSSLSHGNLACTNFSTVHDGCKDTLWSSLTYEGETLIKRISYPDMF